MELCSKVSNNDAAEESQIYIAPLPMIPARSIKIEIRFGILTRKVVRRGIFKSRDELVTRLMIFFEAYNQQARPFEWTYKGTPLTANESTQFTNETLSNIPALPISLLFDDLVLETSLFRLENVFRLHAPEQVEERRNDPCPPRLMTCPEACAVIALELLVKEN